MNKLQTQTPIYLYLHFHWDREWFLTFSTARALLQDRVRATLAALEAGELPNFYLDGQAVVLEDLIEIEPGMATRIETLMKDGRLSAGPWYVLADQSLVGGESLVRNLKIGIEMTRTFGQPVMTGYNPDTFCHIQDLPRILNGFDIDTSVVLRGVPPIGDTNVFWWKSPDGSKVLTYLLSKGLSHPIFHKATEAQEIADDLLARWDLDAANDTTAPMLYSTGGEGMQPPGDLLNKVERLNHLLPANCKAKLVSMESFLDDLELWAKDKTLPEVQGELRDNSSINAKFPAYVLDGVSSTRLYLKRDNVLAERRLIRITEPLFSLVHLLGIMPYPEHDLSYAWKLLLKNHPHDSICGCSVDPVHREMETRTQQFNSFLEGVDFVAMEKLFAWHEASSGFGHKEALGQTLPILPATTRSQPLDPDSRNSRLMIFNTSGYALKAPIRLQWYCEPDTVLSSENTNVQIDSDVLDTNHLFLGGAGPYYQPVRHLEGWLWSDEIPALGYKEIRWDQQLESIKSQPQLDTKQKIEGAQIASSEGIWKINNGLIEAFVDEDGDLIVNEHGTKTPRRFKLGHHLFDVGDAGDSYNFDPISDDIPIKAKLVDVKSGKKGPLVSSLFLSYEIEIPESLAAYSTADFEALNKKRSAKLVKLYIETEICLKMAVPIVFFETVFENSAHDHRLEVRFIAEQPIKQSWSESHFSLAKHTAPIPKLDLPVDVGQEILPQSPFSQRFFIAADQLFLNAGLPEYRIEGNNVEITLLRAVSYLSRGRLRTRGGGAGPWLPTPEANCLGINRCTYAWSYLGQSSSDSLSEEQIIEAYRTTDLFEDRLIAYPIGTFSEARQESLAEISNPAIYLTACYIEQGKLYLRLLNITECKQTTAITINSPIKSIDQVNLLHEAARSIKFKAEPSKAILQLDFQQNELLTIEIELLAG